MILTLACGKYRINDLHLGEIDGLPRIMDMGQCNDAYSAIQVALALADAFHCSVNELPLTLVLSWYEQKAVCILLTLLYLGIRNILLGPTLPAFVSPNVLEVLKETYQLTPISTPEADPETHPRIVLLLRNSPKQKPPARVHDSGRRFAFIYDNSNFPV